MTEEEWYVEWSGYYERCLTVHANPLSYQEYCARWGYRPERVKA